jgi:hypothetical protein
MHVSSRPAMIQLLRFVTFFWMLRQEITADGAEKQSNSPVRVADNHSVPPASGR